MGQEEATPYADDALVAENGVEPDDIQDFVMDRALHPIEVEGLTVWNFNNHEVNREALAKQADNLLYDEYVIPYQASGVWGYMVSLLPESLQEVEILTYNQADGVYNPYPNYIRHSNPEVNDGVRCTIDEKLAGGDL